MLHPPVVPETALADPPVIPETMRRARRYPGPRPLACISRFRVSRRLAGTTGQGALCARYPTATRPQRSPPASPPLPVVQDGAKCPAGSSRRRPRPTTTAPNPSTAGIMAANAPHLPLKTAPGMSRRFSIIEPLRNLHLKRRATRIAASSLFEADWYLNRYPDVCESEIDPALHYDATGEPEAHWPHPLYNLGWNRRPLEIPKSDDRIPREHNLATTPGQWCCAHQFTDPELSSAVRVRRPFVTQALVRRRQYNQDYRSTELG